MESLAPRSESYKSGSLQLVRHFEDPTAAQLYAGDVLSFLKTLNDRSAHLVFLDPPFNLGKIYGPCTKDSLSPSAYEAWIYSILDECSRILTDGGSLYLYHIPSWAITFASYLRGKLDFRHWIAVSMKNGFVRGQRLYPAHYALLFFTLGTPAAFQRPRIPIEKCECGRAKKDYGGYREIVEAKGVNLSDVWEDLSPVRHRTTKRRAQNELPSKLTERILSISGVKDGLFVDPFAGSGSAVISAAKALMQIKACDIVQTNCLLQVKALEDLGFK